jgi:predicted Zn-dependent peptidase
MKIRKIFLKFCLFSLALSALYGAVTAQTVGSNSPRQEKLLNGLKLLMWNDAKANKVAIKVRVHSGSAFDPQGKEGLMKLLAENIFPTPESRDFFKEDLGGSLEVISNYDYIQINTSANPDQFLTLLETVSRAVSNPNIDKETTAKLRAEQVERVKQLERDPAYVADTASAKRLLGTFPYGRPSEGTTDSLARIDFADLIDMRQRFLTADNATIAIYGSFDPDLAYRASRRYFGSWLKADKKIPSTFRQPDPPPTAAQMIVSPVPGNFEIRYVTRGYSLNDKDFAASKVLARIIENRIKENTPAEYRTGIHVRSEARTLPGIIFIGMSGASSPSTEAKIEANDVVAAAIKTKITEAEFAQAKAALVDEWNRKDTVDQWLDIDTFKTVSVAAGRQTLTNLTVADAQRAADILSVQPIAVVVLTTSKEAN